MKASRSVALYLFLTFASGTAVGAFGFWLYNTQSVSAKRSGSRSEMYRKQYLSEMNTRLKLSPEQTQKLVSILDATKQLYRELNDKHKPEYQAIQEHQTQQVEAILDPAQRVEYEKIRKERETRRQQHHHGGM